MRYLCAAAVGILTSIAWNWWAVSVAANSPVQVCVADLAIIGFSAINVTYIAQRRYLEFAAFAVAGALTSGVVVAVLGGR